MSSFYTFGKGVIVVCICMWFVYLAVPDSIIFRSLVSFGIGGAIVIIVISIFEEGKR